MTTNKQIEANRKNAKKSTGPSSDSGKAIVAKNATKHGILSTHVLIEEEEREKYSAFCDGILRSLKPSSDFENFLADRIISTAWRLRRIIHIEALMLATAKECSYNKTYQGIFVGNTGGSMATLSRYERSLENALYRAIKEFRSFKEQDELEVFELSV